MLIIILFILLILYLSSIEHFQYFNGVPKRFVPIKKKNVMFTIPIKDRETCIQLCKETPRCTGVNYFQNKCTLYKNILKPIEYPIYSF